MKRFFTLMCAGALTMTISAQQQIQNPSFEDWENEGTTSVEPAHWNSFMSGTGSMKGFAAAQQVQKSDDAHSGSASAHIYARSVFGVVAQGNLTTGCINMGSTNATDANGNYNYTNESDEAYHQKFTGLPDAMRVWVKGSCAYPAGASCNLHTTGYFQDPAGNTITATRIAQANTGNISCTDSWQEVVIPFNYDVVDGTRPNYALITLTTSGTPGQGKASDYMLVDDVEFLYYSELSGIVFNQKEIAVEGNRITIDGTYDATLLELKSNGQGATISTYYAESSKTLTVTVKGDDIASNPGNSHTYTLVFSGKENEEPITPQPQPIEEEDEETANTFGSLVPYGDFETWKSECGTTHQIATGGGEYKRPGIEPEGWNGSNINMNVPFIGSSFHEAILVEKTADALQTGSAVKLSNNSISYWNNTITFPAFITYANLWAWSGGTNFKNSDMSAYGGIAYTKRPDAIRGQYKRTATTEENAHIIAYLWKGTIQGNIGAWDSPSTPIDDLDRAIMGHADKVGGDGQLIASCDHTFTSTADNGWETITVPLDYVEGQESTIPEKMNIIISSGDYWAHDTSVKGNSLEVDSLEFLFYSDLASATYDGEAIQFNDVNSAVINATYDDTLLSLSARGHSAVIEKSYDKAKHLLTITVKGGNYDENEENKNVYTIQFPFYSEISAASYDGQTLIFNENNAAEVDADYDESKLELTIVDSEATATKSYNAASRILTITVKGGDYAGNPSSMHTYTIHFLSQVKIISERVYTDQIQIKINDASNELQNATITLQETNAGTTNLILQNFKMGSSDNPMYVGSIIVDNIQMDEDGKFQTECTTTIQAGDTPAGVQWLGPILGDVPLQIEGEELRGRNVEDSLHVHIVIDLKERMGQIIDVLFGKSIIDSEGGSEENPSISEKITLPDSQNYEDDLVVTLNGNTTAPQRTTINVVFHKSNNTLDLTLKNFGLKEGDTDMPVGTINVKGIPYTLKSGVPYATFKKDVTVTIEEGDDPEVSMWMGPMLGAIPITLGGKAGVEKLYCTIDINMTGVGIIHVDFGTDADWPKIEGGGTEPEKPEENKILSNRTYTDMLGVTVNGISGKDEEYQVEMEVSEEGLVTLRIMNFYLLTEDNEKGAIGTIEVTGITPVEMPGKDYYLFETDQTITIQEGDNKDELWMGPYLGDIPISMSGKIAEWKLYCNINIFLPSMKENIRVVFGENFTDGIQAVDIEKTTNSEGIFNLSGQRMSKMQKGVNIVKGKKILVR